MQLSLDFESDKLEANVINETIIWENINPYFENIPKPEQEFMPGIKWGCSGQLFTPAYWKVQYLMHNYEGFFNINYRLGENVLEEVVACLLGGFGLKSELGLVAFERLKNRGQIRKGVRQEEILESLKEPCVVNRKEIHYRFPNQKSKYIFQFLNNKDLDSISNLDDLSLRNWLMTLNGIGSKTASWITRNYLNSERVAIIDIHIYRACLIMGLYNESFDVQKNYTKLEQIFLGFCNALEVQPSKMDALIWLQMKNANKTALKIINKL